MPSNKADRKRKLLDIHDKVAQLKPNKQAQDIAKLVCEMLADEGYYIVQAFSGKKLK